MNKDVSERVLIKNRMYLFSIVGGGLEKGVSLEIVSESTGLSEEEINNLIEEL